MPRRSALSPVQLLVLVIAILGAVMLVVAEFTTVLRVQTLAGHHIASVQAGPRHLYALALIGILAIPMAWLAVRGSRPALLALGALGFVAAMIAIVGDLPDVGRQDVTRNAARGLGLAEANAGPALYFETLGAVMLIVATGLGLILDARVPAVGPRSKIGRPRETG